MRYGEDYTMHLILYITDFDLPSKYGRTYLYIQASNTIVEDKGGDRKSSWCF